MAGELAKVEGIIKKHPVIAIGGAAGVFLLVYLLMSHSSSAASLNPQAQAQQNAFQLSMARIQAGVANLQTRAGMKTADTSANDELKSSITGDRYGYMTSKAGDTTDVSLANIESTVQLKEAQIEQSIWSNCQSSAGGSFSLFGLFSIGGSGGGGQCPGGMSSPPGFSFPGMTPPMAGGGYGMPGYGGASMGYGPPSPYGMSPYGMPGYGGASLMTPYGGASVSNPLLSWLFGPSSNPATAPATAYSPASAAYYTPEYGDYMDAFTDSADMLTQDLGL